MMKKKNLAAIFIAVTAIAIVWLFWTHAPKKNGAELEATGTHKNGSSSVLTDVLANVNSASIEHGKPASKTENKSGRHPFPEVPKSRDGLQLKDDPFLAESREEQEWLDRNGYPNASQWSIYSQASDAQLLQAMEAGDEVAGVMLSARKLAAGVPEAKEELLLSAIDGSGFALELYSSYMAGSKTDGNPQAAYSISRVAEMRGNYRLAMARDAMFTQPLTQLQKMQGDAEAMRMFARMKGLSTDLHGNSATWIDPRPFGVPSKKN